MDAQLEELQTLNRRYRELVDVSNKLISEIDEHTAVAERHLKKARQKLGVEANLCTICCKYPRRYCLEPCHHVFCALCANKAQTDRACFVCRQNVDGKHKIYLN